MTERSTKQRRGHARLSIHGALLGLVVAVLLAGFVPAGMVLDRRLTSSLNRSARTDLATAGDVVQDREEQRSAVLMMHAKELSLLPGLGADLAAGHRAEARRRVRVAAEALAEAPVLIDADGRMLEGPVPVPGLVAATRDGAMPVAIASDGTALHRVALAPIMAEGQWMGAAGVAMPLDRSEAVLLAGLTRSLVVVLSTDGEVRASSVDPEVAEALVRAWRDSPADHGSPYATVGVLLGGAARVVLGRDLTQELAVLAQLRGVGLAVGLGALLGALLLGAVVARRLARPVVALATAADRLAEGDFTFPVSGAGVREVRRLGDAFVAMRAALAGRLADLEAANAALADRQRRLEALQAELMHRERLAATGRLVTQLAHEIRNPVANVRNCLELVRRRAGGDPEARRFLDLAVDELLRMHELAEQVLNLNRPHDPALAQCAPGEVAREVAALATAGTRAEDIEVSVHGEAPDVALAPDGLKQVLLNLVQNAGEAATPARVELRLGAGQGRAVLEVLDEGPGIAGEVLDRVFDPFVTTKGAARGVGLGLFVADGIVRGAGGTIRAANRPDRPGAVFRLELPLADSQASPVEAAS
jgi:signal transduction histidine kinase